MLKQQAQQQVLVRFGAIRDQERQITLEVPPIVEYMLALPQSSPIEIQFGRQVAIQILDQVSQIGRDLQFATEQPIGELMEFFGIKLKTHAKTSPENGPSHLSDRRANGAASRTMHGYQPKVIQADVN